VLGQICSLCIKALAIHNPNTGISDNNVENNASYLNQNFPNPFKTSTSFEFNLSESANVDIDIFNTNGVKIASINNGLLLAGKHSVSWNKPSNIKQGVYFYTLVVNGNKVNTKQMVIY